MNDCEAARRFYRATLQALGLAEPAAHASRGDAAPRGGTNPCDLAALLRQRAGNC